MTTQTIAIIGAGNLGGSIVEGLVARDYAADAIIATRSRREKLERFAEMGVQVTTDNCAATQAAKLVVLCVKPYKVAEVLNDIGAHLNDSKVLVSVASGVTISDIRDALSAFGHQAMPVIRAMPNTAIAAQQSMTCIAAESESSAAVVQEVKELFDCIGETAVIREELMDAATVLGACGIAYVLRFIRAMVQGGIEIGFDAQTATRIVNQTVRGAAELLQQNHTHPEQEIDKVTTPKGCTISGLNEMEHCGFSSALIKGIVASQRKILNPGQS